MKKVIMTIEIPDPNQEFEVDEDLSESEIEEKVLMFASDHAANTHHVDWYIEGEE